ncbi:MAG: hypothetical protein KDF65_03380 [Anaerolineae bacterium]|nr:hypothetical protein [Anaerolineae bacterium]
MPKESEPGSDNPLAAAPQGNKAQSSLPWLWAIVIFVLLLNIGLLIGLNLARLGAIEALSQVETMLDNLANEVVVYEVPVNQAVPMQAEVPFNQTFDVPLDTVIALSQTLTVPFGGVDIDLPVQTEVPVQIVVPFTVDEVIAVDTVVQLNTTIPVEVEVARTPLLAYLNQAKYDLARLKSLLTFSTEPSPPLVTPSPPQPSPTFEPSATKLPPTETPTPSPSATVFEVESTATLTPTVTSVPQETVAPSPEATPSEAKPPTNSDTSPPTGATSPASETIDPAGPLESPAPDPPMPLVTYAASVEILGQHISSKAEPFQETALRYWANQTTLEQFEAEFNQFRPEVKEVMRQLTQLSPPQEATTIHQKLIDGLAKCDIGIDMLGTWLETFDESLELPASLQVALCLEETAAAETELRQLLTQKK